MTVRYLLDVLRGLQSNHLYDGDCPDYLQPDAYDPACPRCVAERQAQSLMASLDGRAASRIYVVPESILRRAVAPHNWWADSHALVASHTGRTCDTCAALEEIGLGGEVR